MEIRKTAVGGWRQIRYLFSRNPTKKCEAVATEMGIRRKGGRDLDNQTEPEWTASQTQSKH